MICMYSDINAFAKPSATPYAKRWPRSASGGLQRPCIYGIELDSSVSEIAKKEMQDAVDGTGLNGHVKIY